jgi:hypothetical protein
MAIETYETICEEFSLNYNKLNKENAFIIFLSSPVKYLAEKIVHPTPSTN